nr:gliding motility-associated C-terminal domain-containing protein [Saprospiraceae bacterium]
LPGDFFKPLFMRLLVFFFLLLVNNHSLQGQQNLVPNPNFGETLGDVDCSSANRESPILERVLTHWSSRRRSANFYQLKCDDESIGIPIKPYRDSNFIHQANHFDFAIPAHCCPKEYSQVQLKKLLAPGKNYYLEYYIAPFSLISHLGVLFSDTLIYDAVRNFPWPDPIVTAPHLEVDTIVGTYKQWSRIHHCFTVEQPYDVMTIGVFRSNDYLIERFPVFDSISNIRTSYDAFYLIEVEDQLELKIGELRDTICVGDCITLSTNHSRLPGLFEWQLPGSDIGSSMDSVVVVCYAEPGEYDVGIGVEHCFGEHEELWERAVVVLDHPEREDDSLIEIQVLEGDTVRLSSCLPDEPWPIRWEPHDLLECYDCPEPLYYGLESDTVKAILAPGLSCRDSCTYYIEVIPRAVAVFQADRNSLCVGECVTIENHSRHFSDPISYRIGDDWQQWPGHAEYIEFCPVAAGDYDLQFVVSNFLSADTVNINLLALPLPKRITVTDRFETEYGESIVLEAGFDALEYLWEVDRPAHLELDCTDCPHPQVTTFLSSGIELYASNEFCTDSMNYYIHVNRQEAQIYIPNAFSPNDDGINDRFGAAGLYFTPLSLKVYNRQGGLLFEGRGQDHEWDGTAAGRAVNPGAFLFTFEYENLYGERNMITGEVVILR